MLSSSSSQITGMRGTRRLPKPKSSTALSSMPNSFSGTGSLSSRGSFRCRMGGMLTLPEADDEDEDPDTHVARSLPTAQQNVDIDNTSGLDSSDVTGVDLCGECTDWKTNSRGRSRSKSLGGGMLLLPAGSPGEDPSTSQADNGHTTVLLSSGDMNSVGSCTVLSDEGSQGLVGGFNGGSTGTLVLTSCEGTNTTLSFLPQNLKPPDERIFVPSSGDSVTSAASAVSAASAASVASLDYWLCDHCKVAAFDTEEAAEMHESICKLYRHSSIADSNQSNTEEDHDDASDDLGSLAGHSVQSDGALLLEMTKGYGRKKSSTKESRRTTPDNDELSFASFKSKPEGILRNSQNARFGNTNPQKVKSSRKYSNDSQKSNEEFLPVPFADVEIPTRNEKSQKDDDATRKKKDKSATKKFKRALSMVAHVMDSLADGGYSKNKSKERNSSRNHETSSVASGISRRHTRSRKTPSDTRSVSARSVSTLSTASTVKTDAANLRRPGNTLKEKWWKKIKDEEERIQRLKEKKAMIKNAKIFSWKQGRAISSKKDCSKLTEGPTSNDTNTIPKHKSKERTNLSPESMSPKLSSQTELTVDLSADSGNIECAKSLSNNGHPHPFMQNLDDNIVKTKPTVPELHKPRPERTFSGHEAPIQDRAFPAANDDQSLLIHNDTKTDDDDMTVTSAITIDSAFSLSSAVSAPVMSLHERHRQARLKQSRPSDGFRRTSVETLRSALADRHKRRLSQEGGQTELREIDTLDNAENCTSLTPRRRYKIGADGTLLYECADYQRSEEVSVASFSTHDTSSSLLRSYVVGSSTSNSEYDEYVRTAVDKFRRSLGVSDEEFECWKRGEMAKNDDARSVSISSSMRRRIRPRSRRRR